MANKNFIVKNGLTVGGVDIVNSSGVLTQSLITTVPAATNASTQSVGNSSTLIATTAYVRGEIDALIDSAPGTLNTLDELAAAINDDAQFNTTLTDAVALKAPIASPTFTGNVSFPDDTIDLAHMSANSVDSDQYVDGSIDLVHMSANSVDSDQYVDGSIDAAHLAAAQTNITSVGTLTGLTVNGAAVFNENSADVDFRIESNGTTHMFFVDGGNDKIGIGTDSPGRKLHVNDSLRIAAGEALEFGGNSNTIQNSGNDVFIKLNTNEKFRFTDDGEIGIAGTNYGTDGQVLTSGGAGAAVAWEDAGGGGPTSLVENNSIWLGNDPSSTTNDAQKNVAVGTTALDAITTGDFNTAVGYHSLTSLLGGVQNNCFGSQSGESITSGSYNVAIGQAALSDLTEANNNVAIGDNSQQFGTAQTQNVSVGTDTLRWATGSYNTAVGYAAGSHASNTATWNTLIGWNAGKSTTSGSHNTYVGRDAGYTGANAAQSVAVGGAALYYNVAGNYNVAVGYGALMNTGSSGAVVSNNTALGFNAGNANVAGSENVFIGTYAGDAAGATTAHSHVLVGYNAGTSLTTAVSATLIGRDAGAGLTTAGSNTFVGANAGKDATSGTTSCCIFIGGEAGRGPIVGYHNIAIGMHAFGHTTKGTNAYGNTYMGHYAGHHTTSGDYNTCIGHSSGNDMSTGGNNLLLGYFSGKSTSPVGEITTANNQICLGNNSITHLKCYVSLSATSDERDKADVTTFTGGLDWINAMRPVTYKWDKRASYIDEEEWDETGENLITSAGTSADILAVVPDGTHKEDSLQVGLISQEVLTIEQANGYGSNNDTSLLVDLTEDETSYSLSYERIVPILISAMKEQQTIIDDLKSRIEALE